LREFGDFQTPSDLVRNVLRVVYREGSIWTRALEPTCGLGNFITGLRSLAVPPLEIQGIEVQPRHALQSTVTAEKLGNATAIRIRQADIFKLNLAELPWEQTGPLLVVGNPPWITNAELGGLGSENLPTKSNFKARTGLGAKTGESNFDIAEFIWIKLIKELAWSRPTIALLCKTAVARNVLAYSERATLPISSAEIYLIDTKKWFDAAVDACLFKVAVGLGESNYSASMYADLDAETPQSVLAMANGSIVSNYATYEEHSFLDGESPIVWRQGVKHDASPIMELTLEKGELRNRLGETVSVEEEHVYPLLKSSDLNGSDNPEPRCRVLVTQKELGADTADLGQRAPHLWKYLSSHEDVFLARKSSIYEDRAPFSMFGIGDYSFTDYKVAVSGMYKTIRFRVVGPREGKPVLFDDTCYLAPCSSGEQACLLAALLNDPRCLSFLNSLIFLDSKRPITKKVLQRLDLTALLLRTDRSALAREANQRLAILGLAPISEEVVNTFAWPGAEPHRQLLIPGMTGFEIAQ
jgi:hypothetical protein